MLFLTQLLILAASPGAACSSPSALSLSADAVQETAEAKDPPVEEFFSEVPS